MVHDWILDVLTDLRDFASKNNLGVTEREIDSALLVVSEELASRQGIARGTAHVGHVGEFSQSLESGRNT